MLKFKNIISVLLCLVMCPLCLTKAAESKQPGVYYEDFSEYSVNTDGNEVTGVNIYKTSSLSDTYINGKIVEDSDTENGKSLEIISNRTGTSAKSYVEFHLPQEYNVSDGEIQIDMRAKIQSADAGVFSTFMEVFGSKNDSVLSYKGMYNGNSNVVLFPEKTAMMKTDMLFEKYIYWRVTIDRHMLWFSYSYDGISYDEFSCKYEEYPDVIDKVAFVLTAQNNFARFYIDYIKTEQKKLEIMSAFPANQGVSVDGVISLYANSKINEETLEEAISVKKNGVVLENNEYSLSVEDENAITVSINSFQENDSIEIFVNDTLNLDKSGFVKSVPAYVYNHCCTIGQSALSNDIHIAVNGSDENDGKVNSPVKSFNRAMELYGEYLGEGVISKVYIHGGKYYISETINIPSEYSGISLEAYGDGEVILSGAVPVSKEKFKPTANKNILSEIYEVDISDCFPLDMEPESGWDAYKNIRKNHSLYRLVDNSKLCTIARWPNEGYAFTSKTDSDIGFGTGSTNIQRWANSDSDIMVQGFFGYDYYVSAERVKYVDVAENMVYIENTPYFGLKPSRRYFVYNLLEELDTPGEYYIDTDNKILYYYPQNSEINAEISVLKDPVFEFQNACHDINIKNVTIENVRGGAIKGEEVKNIDIVGCTIRNTGTYAIDFQESNGVNIQSCIMHNNGTTSVYLGGGDVLSLTDSNNTISNCEVYSQGCFDFVDGAVNISGVGVDVLDNYFHDLPSCAVKFTGNDHNISYNRFERVLTDVDDAGAVYSGRNATYRGTKINHNLFKDIESYRLDKSKVHLRGVYFDDLLSGNEASYNVFINCSEAFCVNGGSDNTFKNNIVFAGRNGIKITAVSTKSGTDWSDAYSSGYVYRDVTNLFDELSEDVLLLNKWKTAYPDLFNMYCQMTNSEYSDSSNVDYPQRNNITNNIFVGLLAEESSYNSIDDALYKDDFEDNENENKFEGNFYTKDFDIGFNSPYTGDFTLNENSYVFKEIIGFSQVEITNIGKGEQVDFDRYITIEGVKETYVDTLIEEDFENYIVNSSVYDLEPFNIFCGSEKRTGACYIKKDGENKVLSLSGYNGVNTTDYLRLYFSPIYTGQGEVSLEFKMKSISDGASLGNFVSISGYNADNVLKEITPLRTYESEEGDYILLWHKNDVAHKKVLATKDELLSGYVSFKFVIDKENSCYRAYRIIDDEEVLVKELAVDVPDYVNCIKFDIYNSNQEDYEYLVDDIKIVQNNQNSPRVNFETAQDGRYIKAFPVYNPVFNGCRWILAVYEGKRLIAVDIQENKENVELVIETDMTGNKEVVCFLWNDKMVPISAAIHK